MRSKELNMPKMVSEEDWLLLKKKILDISELAFHRKAYYDALVRFGREQAACGCHSSAADVYILAKSKLDIERRQSNQQIKKERNFSDVDTALSCYAINDSLSILQRFQNLFSDSEYHRLYNAITQLTQFKKNELRNEVPMYPSQKRRAIKFRDDLLNRISNIKWPKALEEAIHALGKKDTGVGMYNTLHNTKSFTRIMGKYDQRWALEFLHHYRRLQNFKNLIKN